ncbi:Transposable element Tc3 transposase [Porphyridium purpureum]|uniref:Transposable element Tc3 transposase n=1 Tax=Porphyridium purpureum TaxID=35688 RepID=A0A5J4YLT5_PORPP|nr:Transposable element Tc3 transposase [Porphyridium purpureum]|eukprot:POR1757..scf246_12
MSSRRGKIMGKASSLTEREQGVITALVAEGHSLRVIADRLGGSRSVTVVRNYLKCPEQYGKRGPNQNAGKMTPYLRRKIENVLKTKPFSTAGQVQAGILSARAKSVSVQTVRRVIRNEHIWKKCKKTPHLQDRHRQARIKFVLDHHWKREEWRDVVFTDEKKWNLDGPDGLKFYWAGLEDEPAVCLSRVYGGQSLMVWGAINGEGKLALLFTKDYYSGGQTAAKYVEMLDKSRVIVKAKETLGYFKFMQDGAASHRAKITMDWLQCNNVEVLDWPALSPDLNPIENVWGQLTRQVYGGCKQYSNVKELRKAVEDAWEKMDDCYVRDLYDSMPKRIIEVALAQGKKCRF